MSKSTARAVALGAGAAMGGAALFALRLPTIRVEARRMIIAQETGWRRTVAGNDDRVPQDQDWETPRP